MFSLATDALQGWIWQAADPLLVSSKCIQENKQTKETTVHPNWMSLGKAQQLKKTSLSLS